MLSPRRVGGWPPQHSPPPSSFFLNFRQLFPFLRCGNLVLGRVRVSAACPQPTQCPPCYCQPCRTGAGREQGDAGCLVHCFPCCRASTSNASVLSARAPMGAESLKCSADHCENLVLREKVQFTQPSEGNNTPDRVNAHRNTRDIGNAMHSAVPQVLSIQTTGKNLHS